MRQGNLYYNDVDLFERFQNFFDTNFLSYDERDIEAEKADIIEYANNVGYDINNINFKDTLNTIIQEYFSETRNELYDIEKFQKIDCIIFKNMYDCVEEITQAHDVYIIEDNNKIEIKRTIIGTNK